MMSTTLQLALVLLLLLISTFAATANATIVDEQQHGSLASASRELGAIEPRVKEVVSELETVYDSHPGFRHFFWSYMKRGEYDLAFLRKYALHYYEHVRVFRLYLAGAMTVVPVEGLQVKVGCCWSCEYTRREVGSTPWVGWDGERKEPKQRSEIEQESRRGCFREILCHTQPTHPPTTPPPQLAEIMADEFGVRLWNEPDVDGHPKLFRRFMRSLGLTEEDWERVSTGKNLLPGIDHYRRVHYSMFQGNLPEEIVGAIIFGMERTTPHRHSSVLDGIKTFSERTGHAVDAQFFSEHVAVDDCK